MRVFLCVCVCEREHCIWYSVHFRLLNLSNNCKVLGQLSSASRSLVLFRFVSFRYLFIHFAYLSHTSLDCCCCFCCFKCSLKSFLLLGTNAIKEEINRRSDEIEFIANCFNAVFRAINKYETNEKITHDTRSAANLAIFPSSLAFFQSSICRTISQILLCLVLLLLQLYTIQFFFQI